MSDAARFAAVVYNPIKVDLDALRTAADRAATDAGWGDTRWYETTVEDPGAGPTRKACVQTSVRASSVASAGRWHA